MPPIPPACAEAEQRFQTFVSTPPVTNYTSNGVIINLFDTPAMRKHIEFIKKTHKQFVENDPADEDIKDYRRFYPRRRFFRVISEEAHHNLITREHGFDEEETEPRARTAYRDSRTALRNWFTEAERLHKAVIDCMPKIKAQLMTEQLYRQSNLVPDVMKNIMEFANAKDPKRIVMDADANRGVTMPRGGRRTRRTKRRGTSRAGRR
jgi:hypothetical protein